MQSDACGPTGLRELGLAVVTALLFGIWLVLLNLAQLVVPLGDIPPFLEAQLAVRRALMTSPIGLTFAALMMSALVFVCVRVVKTGKHRNVFVVLCAVGDVALLALILLERV